MTTTRFDVVVYGAPAGGVLAAVASARRGARTALLCSTWPDCYAPSLRIGGLTTVSMRIACIEDMCSLSVHGVPFRQDKTINRNSYSVSRFM